MLTIKGKKVPLKVHGKKPKEGSKQGQNSKGQSKHHYKSYKTLSQKCLEERKKNYRIRQNRESAEPGDITQYLVRRASLRGKER